jgi:hypothetical protein
LKFAHRVAPQLGVLLLTDAAPGPTEPGDSTHGVLLATSVEETVGLWQEWPLTKSPTVNPDADPVIIPALAEVSCSPPSLSSTTDPSACSCCTKTRSLAPSTTSCGIRRASAHHTHSAAHTMVVLEGDLLANGQRVGPSGYVHFPAGSVMHHAPSEDEDCVFVVIFHGPYDVHPAQEPAQSP